MVCPWWLNFLLDNPVRRWLFPVSSVLQPYLKRGMTFVDVGCGGGRFAIAAADLVGASGKVYAMDIQQKMLDIVSRKVQSKGLGAIVETHLTHPEQIELGVEADFVLAMCMVHETPDKSEFFRQVKAMLRKGGKLLIVEPRGHVGRSGFIMEVSAAEHAGFKCIEEVYISRICRACLLSNEEKDYTL